MKPRLLLNIAAVVSLLLAVAILFLWARSHGRRESIYRRWRTSTESRILIVESRYSSLEFRIVCRPGTYIPIARSYEYHDTQGPDPRRTQDWFPFSPVSLQHFIASNSSDIRGIVIAYWLLLPLALILPTIAFARHRRRRRREAGNLCPTCGYDLRAHAAGDRCPECGTSIQSTRGSCATQS